MKRWLTAMASALLCGGPVGCATTASAPAPDRQLLLQRTLDQVLYRRPAEEVLEAARAILDERGYTVLASTDPYYVRTGWKTDGNPDSASHSSRLLLQGRRLPDGRFFVRAFEQQLTSVGRAPAHPSLGGGNKDANKGGEGANTNYVAGEPLVAAPVVTRRAPEVEWALLARLEPAFARTVERQVDVYVANHQPPEELEGDP